MNKSALIILMALLMLPGFVCEAQFAKLVVSMNGRIFNELTKEPIGIEFEVFDEQGTRINRARSNSADGSYFITTLEPGKKYVMKPKEMKYLKQSAPFEIPNTDKYAEFSKDFMFLPAQKDMAFPLMVSPFKPFDNKIRTGADMFLKRTVDLLKENIRIKFDIQCFSDKDEDPAQNKTITEARCNSLKQYLIENGIDEKRISIMPETATDPKNPPPARKTSKGKRYIGTTYIIVRTY
jgi:hypothetical protein